MTDGDGLNLEDEDGETWTDSEYFLGNFCWTDWVGLEGRENGDQECYPNIWLGPLGISWDDWTSWECTQMYFLHKSFVCMFVCVCVCVCVYPLLLGCSHAQQVGEGAEGWSSTHHQQAGTGLCCSYLLILALTACSPHAMHCAKCYQY